jgi:hypothetical protein
VDFGMQDTRPRSAENATTKGWFMNKAEFKGLKGALALLEFLCYNGVPPAM